MEDNLEIISAILSSPEEETSTKLDRLLEKLARKEISEETYQDSYIATIISPIEKAIEKETKSELARLSEMFEKKEITEEEYKIAYLGTLRNFTSATQEMEEIVRFGDFDTPVFNEKDTAEKVEWFSRRMTEFQQRFKCEDFVIFMKRYIISAIKSLNGCITNPWVIGRMKFCLDSVEKFQTHKMTEAEYQDELNHDKLEQSKD